MEPAEDFDYQAAHHQDQLLMDQATLERLLELRLLVDACSNYTWLNQDDVDGIALMCGLYTRFKNTVNQPKKEVKSG